MTGPQTLQPLLSAPAAADKARARTEKALRKTHPALRELAHKQLLEALSDLLDVPLTGLVLDALQHWHELVEVAEQTQQDPGLRKAVVLAAQRFSGTRSADLEVDLDGRVVTTVPARLEVEVEVRGLVASVTGGCIHQLVSGESAITATLFLDEVALPPYSQRLDLTVALSVDPPLRLVPVPEEVRLPDTPVPRHQKVRS